MNRAFASRAKSVIGRSASEHAANDAAHDPADEGGTGIRATTATLTAAAATAAATSAAAARRTSRLFVGVVAGGGWGGCDDFCQQRLVLQPVEVTGLGVAARRLPARNHRTRRLVELAGNLGIETKAGQPALHVAALAFVEADLVFRGLAGFLSERQGIDAGRQVAGRGRQTALQSGDPSQRERFELAIGIAGQISVELFRLVRFLDRAPKFQLDVGSSGG